MYGRTHAQNIIAVMHGPHSVFDIGHCTVIHRDAGSVSLVAQSKEDKKNDISLTDQLLDVYSNR